MDLSTLKYAEGSRKKRKRVGRGDGSGHGGTSCRGHKGYHSRSGSKSKIRFEGGQTPLQRRVPKRGFRNIFKKIFQVINLADLLSLQGEAVITPALLFERRLIRKQNIPIKILGEGEINWAVEVQANAFSSTAKQKIEAANGRVHILC
jgi:large subunit ribosomal protein L15